LKVEAIVVQPKIKTQIKIKKQYPQLGTSCTWFASINDET